MANHYVKHAPSTAETQLVRLCGEMDQVKAERDEALARAEKAEAEVGRLHDRAVEAESEARWHAGAGRPDPTALARAKLNDVWMIARDAANNEAHPWQVVDAINHHLASLDTPDAGEPQEPPLDADWSGVDVELELVEQILHSTDRSKMADALSQAFVWDNAPRGYEYWAVIERRLRSTPANLTDEARRLLEAALEQHAQPAPLDNWRDSLRVRPGKDGE